MTVEVKPAPTTDRLVLRPSGAYVLGFVASSVIPFAVLAGVGAALHVRFLQFGVVPLLLNTGWMVFVVRGEVVIDAAGVELERVGQRLAWPTIRSIDVAPVGRRGRKRQAYFIDRMGQRCALLTWGPSWRRWHWTATEVHAQLDRIDQRLGRSPSPRDRGHRRMVAGPT